MFNISYSFVFTFRFPTNNKNKIQTIITNIKLREKESKVLKDITTESGGPQKCLTYSFVLPFCYPTKNKNKIKTIVLLLT